MKRCIGRTAFEVLLALQEGDPRIFLNEERAWAGKIGISPMELSDEDLPVIATRLRALLEGSGGMAKVLA